MPLPRFPAAYRARAAREEKVVSSDRMRLSRHTLPRSGIVLSFRDDIPWQRWLGGKRVAPSESSGVTWLNTTLEPVPGVARGVQQKSARAFLRRGLQSTEESIWYAF